MKTIPVRPQPALSQRRPAPSRSLESLLTLIILLATLCQQAAAQSPQSPAEEAKSFDIPAQSLEGALIEWSRQADVQVMVAGDVLKGHKAQPLKGTLGTRVALATLLKDTGLEAKFAEADRTVTVTREASAGEAPENRSQGASRATPGEPPTPVQRPGSDKDTANRQPPREGADTRPLEEVVVTGTHIRGGPPAGAQLIVFDRQDIERSAFTTTHDFLHALPQNFGGGPNEQTNFGAGDQVNSSVASSINLRGLGSAATLVLLNGRRLAPAGIDASFVDVSSIPLAAIDRIEVLPDGASAIYGADAVGGVVNLILRTKYDDAESSVQYGSPTEDGAGTHVQVSQSLGSRWESGDVLVFYEYYDRDQLAAHDRRITASEDLRPFGGDDRRSLFSNPGTIAVGPSTYAIPAGQDGRMLDPALLIEGTENRRNDNETLTLLPDQKRHSVVAAINQEIGGGLKLFLNGLHSQRDALTLGGGINTTLRIPPSNAFYVNPTGGTETIRMRYNFADDLGPNTVMLDVNTSSIAAGAELRAGGAWRLSVEGGYADEEIDQVNGNRPITGALNAALADSNPATAFNPFGDGSFTNPSTLAAIRGTQSFASTSSTGFGSVAASGPVLTLPAGDIALALGVEYRQQQFDSSVQLATAASEYLTAAHDRDVTAGFAEVRAPLFGSTHARSWLAALELTLAARHEDYSDFGSATVPKIGLAWSPHRDLVIRGTWGKSFKAPTLPELSEAGNFIFPFTTPDSTGTEVLVLGWSGGNTDLKEETATTWSAGVDLAPSDFPNLRLQLTYFQVRFNDRVAVPPFGLFLLDPALATFVTRNPTPAQVADVCSRGTYLGTDLAECLNTPYEAIVDSRSQNVAKTRQRGVDLGGVYGFDSRVGRFDVALNGAYLFDLEQAQLPSSPLTDVLNTPRNPIDFKVRGSLTWTRGNLTASTHLNYVDSYVDNLSVPARKIDSWVTADLQIAYAFRDSSDAWLDGLSMALNVQNLFDEAPPFFNNPDGIGYDATNADIFGRVVSARIRKRW